MFNFTELLQSKKFKVMAATVIGLIVMDFAIHGTVTPDTLNKIFGIVSVYLGAQGLQDYGRAKNGNPGPLPPNVGDGA